MENLLDGIRAALLVVVVGAVVAYTKKKGWLQGKKLIFVGAQQFVFVYTLLIISIITAALSIPYHNNIFSYATLFLLILTFALAMLNHLIPATILIVVSLITNWFASAGTASSFIPDWYFTLLFVLPAITLLFLWSIQDDNNLSRKPWNTVETLLREKGVSDLEIEKIKEYWQEKGRKIE